MDKSNFASLQWIKIFVLRGYGLYLLLVFLFVSNFLDTYHFKAWLNKPFFIITDRLTRLAGHLFSTRQFHGHVQFRDYYSTYIALLVYLFIAIVIAFCWTVADKGKKGKRFFDYTWVFARYYLAAILLGYGISKLLGDQFGQPDFASLIRPLGDFDSRNLFWEFMGASKSYQIFGGLLETLAGLMLLFRRTTTVGCLLALSLFLNVLMLDIAYDVFVKVRIFYFLLLTIFILAPDLKALFSILVLKRNMPLADAPLIITNEKYKWAKYVFKYGLIGVIAFVILRKQDEVYHQYHYPSQGSISGIYSVDKFYLNGQLRQQANTDSISWVKIAINQYFPIAAIQLMNDSVTDYAFRMDTVKRFIDLTSYHDPQLKFRLQYSNVKSGEWVFEGVFKNDSIRFISKKIKPNFILKKDYGKVRWDYGF